MPEPIYPYVRMNTGPRPTPIGWADISTVSFPDVPFSGTPTEKMSFDESIDAGKGDIFGYGKLTGVDIKNITPTLTLIDEIGGEKAVIKRINTNNELTLVNAINKPGTGIVSKAIISSKNGVSSGEGGIITIGSVDATLNLLGTIGAVGLPHNGLASKQGGTTDQYYHLTAAEYSALHSAVTIADTTSVDITLTGQQISAVVLPAGVDHNLLAGKQGGTTSEYYHLTSAEYSALHPAITISDTNSINLTLSTQQISADLIYQDTTSVDLAVDASGLKATVLPAGVDHNSLANLTVGNPHTQYSGINAEVYGDLDGYMPVPYILRRTQTSSYTSQSSSFNINSSAADERVSQTFTPSVAARYMHRRITVKLQKVLAPVGDVYAELYETNLTGLPVGAAVAESEHINCEEISTSPANYDIVFSRTNGAKLANSEYCVVLRGSYIQSATDYIRTFFQPGAPATGMGRYNTGAWEAVANTQLYLITEIGEDGANVPLSKIPVGASYLPIANLPLSIPDRKFAQITTAGKVSGTALTGLASVPAGAGILPIANGGTGGDTALTARSALGVGEEDFPYFTAVGTRAIAGSAAYWMDRINAASAAVANLDIIGTLGYGGWDGDSWQWCALIRGIVGGIVANEQVPMDIVFYTSATTSAALAERMRIKSTGVVNISNLAISQVVMTDANKNLVSFDYLDQAVKVASSPTFADITDSGLTASQVVMTDANKKLVSKAGYIFVPRDCAGIDFSVTSFGTSGSWQANGLDLSAILAGTGAVAVALEVAFTATNAGDNLALRKNGTTAIYNSINTIVPVAGQTTSRLVSIVSIDNSDYKMDYFIAAGVTAVIVNVVGYYV